MAAESLVSPHELARDIFPPRLCRPSITKLTVCAYQWDTLADAESLLASLIGLAMHARMKIEACYAPSPITSTSWHRTGWYDKPICDLGFGEYNSACYVGLGFETERKRKPLPNAELFVQTLLSGRWSKDFLAGVGLWLHPNQRHDPQILIQYADAFEIAGMQSMLVYAPISLASKLPFNQYGTPEVRPGIACLTHEENAFELMEGGEDTIAFSFRDGSERFPEDTLNVLNTLCGSERRKS